MKRLFFSIGVLLLLSGIVLSVNYNSSKLMKAEETVAAAYDTWEVSGTFKAGDHIRILCYPGRFWDEMYLDPGDDIIPYQHRHIWFYIFDPYNRTTEFNTAWTNINPSTGQTVPFTRCFVNWTVRDGIISDQYPLYVGGNVTVDGTYTVRVDREFDPEPVIPDNPSGITEKQPPTYFAIVKIYPVNVYPYTYLLPAGISFSIVGVVISTWSAKSPKGKRRYISRAHGS